jgi:hypothetical protein
MKNADYLVNFNQETQVSVTDLSSDELESIVGGAIGFVGGVATTTFNAGVDGFTGSPNAIPNLVKGVGGTLIATGLGAAFGGVAGASLSGED